MSMDVRSFVKVETIPGGETQPKIAAPLSPRHTEIIDHLARKICKDLGIPFTRSDFLISNGNLRWDPENELSHNRGTGVSPVAGNG